MTGREHTRVLHVCDFAAEYPGAFIAQLRRLAVELDRRGAGTTAFAFPRRAEGRPWLGELEADGYPIFLLEQTSPRPSCAGRAELLKVLEETQADIAHSHFGTFDTSLAAAVRALPAERRPGLVWHYRTALEAPVGERSPVRRLKDLLRYRWWGRGVDLCIGVTHAMGMEAAARGMGSRAIGIVSGCDTDRFHPDAAMRSAGRTQLGAADDDVVILHLGWQWHRKGGDLLARALQTLDDPRVIAYSIGADPKACESPVRSLTMTPDIELLYNAADIFVSASRSEGFGNGLVEAMACGKVAVAALADGQRELFEHLDGCVAVPIGDGNALARALASLLDHRDQWQWRGESNRAHVVATLGLDRWSHAVAEVYDGIDQRSRQEALADSACDAKGEAA